MIWIAPSEKDANNGALEKRLWDTADPFRPRKCEVRVANSEVQSVRHSKFVIRHSPRLWIQLFHSALNEKGRAGFLMANSASEQEPRRQLIESRAVDVMVKARRSGSYFNKTKGSYAHN